MTTPQLYSINDASSVGSVDAVNKWTLAREDRLFARSSLDLKRRGLLCGGECVMVRDGSILTPATLSFCCEDQSGDFLGVTVGHIAKQVGDKVFAFQSDGPDESGHLEIVEIGEVTSLCRETDSLVFTVNSGIGVYLWCAYRETGMVQDILPPPSTSVTVPRMGTKVSAFGAQKSLSVGIVGRLCSETVEIVPFYSVGNNGKENLSNSGAVYADDQGTAWFMHQRLAKHKGLDKSYGMPLSAIMDSHPFCFGRSGDPRKTTRQNMLQANQILSRATEKLSSLSLGSKTVHSSPPSEILVFQESFRENGADRDSESLYIVDGNGVTFSKAKITPSVQEPIGEEQVEVS